ncbi:MAG: slipin family protein [bacterium]|nr:slipin family protein [bacterium]
MGGIMTMAPRWHTVIGLGVIYWALLRFIWGGMEIWPMHFAAPLGLLFSASIEVAKQWEKTVVLRLGKFQSLKGPGFFTILPLIDRADAYIDQRVRVTDFAAETTLTKDTVPVSVDAIAFWMVWDAKMSVLEVADFNNAITLAAQTALRDAIGKHDLAEMLTDRDRIGSEIQAVLDTKTTPWGITIQSIEIRDVVIPKELEDAMSRQAQAERERHSRVILGTAETEIAEKFALASESYRDNPVALHLRAMNMVFEGLKKKGSMVIVPSSAVETMGLGALGGLASLGKIGDQGGAAEEQNAAPDPVAQAPSPTPESDIK